MRRLLAAILLGGWIAGTLDILYAFLAFGPLSYGVSPGRILHSIAAGWIGNDAARAGGMETALLGLASHFLIATAMATVFVVTASRLLLLRKRPLFAGIVCGLMLYIVMNYIVVPLSAAGGDGFALSFDDASARLREAFSGLRPEIDPEHPWLFAGSVLIHVFGVGVPIALVTKRCAPQQV